MVEALRIGLVAGELSGDRLGAALIGAIRNRHPQAQFEGIAGPGMREAGCRALARANKKTMGLADGVIMATIITVHMMNIRPKLTNVQGCMAALDISAPMFIAMPCMSWAR